MRWDTRIRAILFSICGAGRNCPSPLSFGHLPTPWGVTPAGMILKSSDYPVPGNAPVTLLFAAIAVNALKDAGADRSREQRRHTLPLHILCRASQRRGAPAGMILKSADYPAPVCSAVTERSRQLRSRRTPQSLRDSSPVRGAEKRSQREIYSCRQKPRAAASFLADERSLPRLPEAKRLHGLRARKKRAAHPS